MPAKIWLAAFGFKDLAAGKENRAKKGIEKC
jgi:hypothetical protein